MIKLLFFTILSSFILVGCSTAPKYDKLEIQEIQIVYQKVPSELTEPCIPSKKPPIREEFLKLHPHERESALAKYSIILLGDLKNCNVRIKKIRELPMGKETN